MDFKKVKFFIEPSKFIFSADITDFKQTSKNDSDSMQSFSLTLEMPKPCKGFDLNKINKLIKENNQIKAVFYNKSILKNSDVYDRVFFKFKSLSTEGVKKVILYKYSLSDKLKEHLGCFPLVEDQCQPVISKQIFKEVLEDLRMEYNHENEEVTLKEDIAVLRDGPSFIPVNLFKKASYNILKFLVDKFASPTLKIIEKVVGK